MHLNIQPREIAQNNYTTATSADRAKMRDMSYNLRSHEPHQTRLTDHLRVGGTLMIPSFEVGIKTPRLTAENRARFERMARDARRKGFSVAAANKIRMGYHPQSREVQRLINPLPQNTMNTRSYGFRGTFPKPRL
jgi:hypothetical protein